MRARALVAASAGCLALGLGLPAEPATSAAAATLLCGSMAGTPSHATKVLWIAMENESYGTTSTTIPGSASDPYIKNTLTPQCGSTSNYHAVTHPSYPNYIALTSGDTQGHTTDSLAYFNTPSIFSQVDPSWRGYEEFMPTPCDHIFQTGSNPPSEYYLGRHNPAASYSAAPIGAPGADCTTHDIAMGTTTSGALQQDVSAGSLPSFSMITPGLCDDMHAVPVGDTSCPDIVRGGDNWLSTWIPILTSGPDYTSGNLVIDVVWDEGRGGTTGASCTTSSATDCIVPNYVISPYTTPSTLSATNYSHYSLLRTTEEILGVPLLGHAADADTKDMCGAFGVCPPSNAPPTASFTYSCAGLSCTFDGTGSSAPGGSITDYSWDFGDVSTGSGATPSHTYAGAATYPVTLTVTDDRGATDAMTQQVTVSNQTAQPIDFVGAVGTTGNALTEKVTVPSAVAGGDVMVLTATGNTTSALQAPPGWALAGTVPNTVMTTAVWTKVATGSDAGSAVTVTYPSQVKGSVQLAAYSGVDPSTPVAAFASGATHTSATSATTPAVTVPLAGDWVVSNWAVKSSAVNSWTPPASAVVRNSQIGIGGSRDSALFADGGGPAAAGPAGGLSATTDQAFTGADTTSVVLAAAGGCGSSCAPTPPTAAFSSSCTGLSCQFDGSASSPAPGSTITSYSWAFGDSGTGSGATPAHIYASGNTYSVTLSVNDADGLSDSVTHQVTVASTPPPSIGFVAATGVTKNATTETVTVPATVSAGNAMVLVATGVTTGTLQAPPGWTLVATQPNTATTTAIWSRVATASDHSTNVTVTFPAQVKGSVQLAAYSGTNTSNPVAAVTGAATHVTSSTTTAPPITLPATGDWLVSYWSVKSSAVTSLTGQSGTSARTLAIGSGGGQMTSLLSDSGSGLPAGSMAGRIATADQPFSASDTLSVALAPAS